MFRASMPGVVAVYLTAVLGVAPRLSAQATVSPALSESQLCLQATQPATATAARAAMQQTLARATGASAAFLRGCQQLIDGNSGKAVDEFEQVTKLAPTRASGWSWLGRAYGDQARKANVLSQALLARKTKQAFERAVQLDPDDVEARTFLAAFYQMAPSVMGGNEQLAIQQIDAIRARNPYMGAIASAGLKARRKDVTGAVAELTPLTRSYPDSIGPWRQLFNVHLNAKQWAEATRTLESARKALPRSRWPDSAQTRLAERIKKG